MRYYPKRADRNQASIVAALTAAGCTVVLLHRVGEGCPDLLVGVHEATWLLEVKTPQESARLARGTSHNRATAGRQSAWAARWRGAPPIVVHSPEGALQALGLVRERPKPTGAERFYPG